MTDRQPLAPADDEAVRRALMVLLDDVDAVPLPEPAMIRARGDRDLRSRRTRRLAVLGVAAAAVIGITAAGFHSLTRPQAAETAPATSVLTSAPTSGTASPTSSESPSSTSPSPEESSTSTSDEPPSDPTGTSTGDPSPQDEPMEVAGTLPASAFIPASQWASQTLTGGTPTASGTLELEGDDLQVSDCLDTPAGNLPQGVVGITSGPGDANFIGRQRVERHGAPSSAQGRVESLTGLYDGGCTQGDRTVTSTPGPRPGTWRMETVIDGADSTEPFVTWVGVVAAGSDVTTLVFHQSQEMPEGFSDTDGWQELGRLLDLAAARG